MSSSSPASVLYSSDGYELAVVDNASFVAGQRALLISGVSPTNKTVFALSTGDGVVGAAQMSNRQFIQIASTVTSSGSANTSTLLNGAQEVALVVNVGTVTGAGSIQYTIQEVDPGDSTTAFGNSASTVVINSGNAPGVFTAVLNVTTSCDVRITWTVTGTFSATIYSTIVTKSTPSSQTITGTISTTNLSIGAVGSAPPADATYVASLVSTNAPTYTDGYMEALSLTTSGRLRIDGAYPLATATASAPDMSQVGGIVTTAAPTYVDSTINALSLTTAGALRVDGSAVTQPVSGTVTANQGTSPWVTSVSNTVTVSGTVTANQGTSPWIVAGGGTAGTPASGVVTVQGISGMTPLSVQTNKAATSAVTSVASSATNVTLLAANSNRVFASIYNESSKQLYIKLGSTASNTSYSILLMPNSYWEVPNDYTGQIDAVWAAANGNARVTELTP